MNLEKLIFLLILSILFITSNDVLANNHQAYDQSKLDSEMELLQKSAFIDSNEEIEKDTSSTAQTNKNKPKTRLRENNVVEDNSIVDLEGKYFDKKKIKDSVKTMNAAPIREEELFIPKESKKRSR